MRRGIGVALATAILLVLLAACGVTAGDSLNQCTETIPSACGEEGHCTLASDQYLQGQFPSTQIFIIHTATPALVPFSFEFTNRISAGTTLSLTSTEPDCSGESSYTSPGDLFQTAGPSGVLSFPITMMQAGDHLIQFSSDAYCSYALAYQ